MQIECPGCEATYEVPQSQIRPGRSVRCARCAMQWRPAGEEPEVAAEPAPPPASRPAEPLAPAGPAATVIQLRRHADPMPAAGSTAATSAKPAANAGIGALRRRLLATLRGPVLGGPNMSWGIGWAASLVLLSGLLGSAGYWRQAIMQGWPPSERLYGMLGMPPRGTSSAAGYAVADSAHISRAATAARVEPIAAAAISSSPSKINPPGVIQ